MNSQDQIYKDYADKNKTNIIYQTEDSMIKIRELIKDIEPFSYKGKIYSSMKDAGIYKLGDERILELKCSNGWIYKGFIFNNENDWNNYREPLPREMYFEG
jgi:hypothetical protein